MDYCNSNIDTLGLTRKTTQNANMNLRYHSSYEINFMPQKELQCIKPSLNEAEKMMHTVLVFSFRIVSIHSFSQS